MTDELLLRRLRIGWHDDDTPIWVSDTMVEAADRIEQLTAERDEALECNEEFFVDNQILKKRVEETRKEWEGWQSASVKLMKQVTALTAERDKYEIAWMTAEGKLEDAVQGLEKCQEELDAYSRQEYPLDHTVHERYRQRDYNANPARITLAALKGESHE